MQRLAHDFHLRGGGPKPLIGFWVQTQDFHVGFGGGSVTFYVGFRSRLKIFMCILETCLGLEGTTAQNLYT